MRRRKCWKQTLIFLNLYDFQNKQGPPPHPYVPRNGTGRAGGKPPTARGHVKKVKGKKGKKGKKDQYDLIVNIDLVSTVFKSTHF